MYYHYETAWIGAWYGLRNFGIGQFVSESSFVEPYIAIGVYKYCDPVLLKYSTSLLLPMTGCRHWVNKKSLGSLRRFLSAESVGGFIMIIKVSWINCSCRRRLKKYPTAVFSCGIRRGFKTKTIRQASWNYSVLWKLLNGTDMKKDIYLKCILKTGCILFKEDYLSAQSMCDRFWYLCRITINFKQKQILKLTKELKKKFRIADYRWWEI